MSFDPFDIGNGNKSPCGDLYTKVRKVSDNNFYIYISNISELNSVKSFAIFDFCKLRDTGLIDKMVNPHTYVMYGIISSLIDIGGKFILLFDTNYINMKLTKEEQETVKIALLLPLFFVNPKRQCEGNVWENMMPLDPVTLESIPNGQRIEIGNTCYFESTIANIVNSNNPRDPLTRERLPQDIINRYLINIPTTVSIDGNDYEIDDGVLDLSDNDIETLESISHLAPFIKELYIGRNNISDLTPIKEFKHLNILSVSSTNITNIDVVRGFPDLRVLNLDNCNFIESFDPILSCLSLTDIYVSETNIYSLDFLRNCISLRIVHASSTGIDNIEVLRNKNSLIDLDISGTAILDLSPLNDKIYLQSLLIDQTGVTNIEILRNKPFLTYLRMDETEIEDISPIENSHNLYHLTIKNTLVSDISVLRNMNSLEEINIENCNIKDISPLFECSNLQYVYMKGVNVENYMELVEMESMRYIISPDGTKINSGITQDQIDEINISNISNNGEDDVWYIHDTGENNESDFLENHVYNNEGNFL